MSTTDSVADETTQPSEEVAQPEPVRVQLIRYDIPLRRDLMVWLVLPRELTKADADRLCGILQTLPLDEDVHRPLQTVTPSGRVWNEQAWRFDDPGGAS